MQKPNLKAKINTFFYYLIINIVSSYLYVKMYKKILFIRNFEPFSFKFVRVIVKINFK